MPAATRGSIRADPIATITILEQVNRLNLAQLQVAWEYHKKDSGQTQSNLIIVDGVWYGMTAFAQPSTWDVATGKELWKGNYGDAVQYNTSRWANHWTGLVSVPGIWSASGYFYSVRESDDFPHSVFACEESIFLLKTSSQVEIK